MMTSKERVKCAFSHRQPDKMPIDFGGMSCSQMHITIIKKLRDYYGLENRPIPVHDIACMTGLIEDDLKDAIGVDVEHIRPYRNSFAILNDGNWKEYRLFGVDILVPDQWELIGDDAGGWKIFPQGNRSVAPSGHLPARGYYFDNIERAGDFDEDDMDPADNLEEYGLVTEDELDYYRRQVEKYRDSKRAVVFDPGGAALADASQTPGPGLLHPKGIRKIADWYTAPLLYPEYVHEVFDRQSDIFVENLKKYAEVIGDVADIIYLCGTDFGNQRSQMCSVATFDEFYKPYYSKMCNYIHEHTSWKTLKHSCGAVYPMIPGLIEGGFDALNPVQCSADGMDPQWLKDTFGGNIVFWGGGVDTQKVLPFGTPEEVRRQVLERCEIFSKNGGYIFNSIHIVQCNTPLENVVAMIDAAHEFNGDR